MDGDMNIFEILQMFRDNHGGHRLGALGSEPIQQLLLAAAQAHPENDMSDDDLDDDRFDDHFLAGEDDHLLHDHELHNSFSE